MPSKPGANPEPLSDQETIYRQLVEHASDMLSLHDTEGVYRFASAYCRELFGYAPEELVGRNAYDFIHLEDIPAVENSHQSILQTDRPDRVEFRIRHRDGHYVWVETTSKSVRSQGDAQEQLIVATTRKTEQRKQVEQRLMESEAQLKQSQSVARIGHYVFSIEAGSWTSSQGLDEIFGIDPEYERSVTGWVDLIHPEEREGLLAYLTQTVLRDRQKFNRQYRVVRPADGNVRWVHGLGELEFAEDGRPVKMFGTIQDITEQKILLMQQEFLQKRLEALWNISRLVDADLKTICDRILDEIVSMTNSAYGFYGFLNDAEDALLIHSWSIAVMDDCAVHDRPLSFPIAKAGIWGNAVRQRRPFVLNDYQSACEHKTGLPEGHVALTRVLAVPVILDGKIIAVAAVANKPDDYVAADPQQLEAFLQSVHVLIERKQVEERLKASEERYRILFEQAAHGAAVAEIATGKILACNSRLAEMLGRPAEEIVGQHQSILHPEESLKGGESKTYQMHLAGQEDQILEDQLIHRNGQRIDVEILASRMELDGKEALYGFFYDVSARKKLMEEYRRATQLASLGTVAAGVAHEINNPIQGILNYATLLCDQHASGDRTHQIAERILHESRRIAEITRELLDFARDDRQKEPLDLREVVDSALDLVERKVVREGISIETRYDESLPVLLIHRQGIQQIVINLVDNACDALCDKSMPLDQKVIKVSCYLNRCGDGQEACLEVYDEGIGMPPQTLARAAETFFSTKPSNRGTGLGLSIVADIVNRHNGKLEIDSREDQYTRVLVSFPIEVV